VAEVRVRPASATVRVSTGAAAASRSREREESHVSSENTQSRLKKQFKTKDPAMGGVFTSFVPEKEITSLLF
jgi:hypothetical protein